MKKIENAPLGVLLSEDIVIIDALGNKISSEQAESVLCTSAARDCTSFNPFSMCDDD